jgi:aspartate/glutamate racemase
MPANLPHLYFDFLTHEVTTPVLNLVEAVVEALPAKSGPTERGWTPAGR